MLSHHEPGPLSCIFGAGNGSLDKIESVAVLNGILDGATTLYIPNFEDV